MRIFLLWSRSTERGRKLAPESVGRELALTFSPLFSPQPQVRTLCTEFAALVVLELPVVGWKPPFFQEDERTQALAVDFPVNGRPVLTSRGMLGAADALLPTLGRQLSLNPEPLLRDLAPPFSLIWAFRESGETFVQTDGLGQAQLYEFQDTDLWACSNKVAAFKALGISLNPEPESWAVRMTHGWFPLDRCGFENIRHVASGSQFRLDGAGVHRTQVNVLSDWVMPTGLSKDDCLELARQALHQHIDSVMSCWELPATGLSGGWDTRALVAVLRAKDVGFSAYVKGQEGKFDRKIAIELARIADLDLEFDDSAELPPPVTSDLRHCIYRGLLWQMASMWSESHKSFLWNEKYLNGGNARLMGQHGEIGRGYYGRKTRALEVPEPEFENRLVQMLLKDRVPSLRADLLPAVEHLIRQSYKQADSHGLTGLARMDFFYLYERTRRYNAAAVASRPGIVVTPFLNPDFIRASFGYRAAGGVFHEGLKQTNPLHRYIIGKDAPDWVNVPYERDLMKQAKREQRAQAAIGMPSVTVADTDWSKSPGKQYYDYSRYWTEVGRPIIDAAIAGGGFWTRVFDPDLVARDPASAPVEIGIVHILENIL